MKLSACVCFLIISLFALILGLIWLVPSLKSYLEQISKSKGSNYQPTQLPVNSTQPTSNSTLSNNSASIGVSDVGVFISASFSALSFICLVISTFFVCRIYRWTREERNNSRIETSVAEINEVNVNFSPGLKVGRSFWIINKEKVLWAS